MANESFSEFVKRCAESCNCNAESNTANQARVLIGKLAEKLDEDVVSNTSYETFTFTLEDGSTVTKKVVVIE